MRKSDKRILIVDDEQAMIDTLHLFFTEKGWKVETTNDGIGAVKIAKEFQPDIMLLDVKMPKRDGISTCRLIRNDLSITDFFPIIIMTGDNNRANITQAIKAGCNDIALKPFDLGDLTNKVEKHLKITEPPVRKKEVEDKIDKDNKEHEVIIYSKQAIERAFKNLRDGNKLDYPAIKEVVNKMVKMIVEEKYLPIAYKIKSYDEYTYIHSVNVSSLSIAFAYQLGWEEKDLKIVGEGGLLHDIGMSKIDSQLLIKRDILSKTEFNILKSHPVHGSEIAADHNVNGDVRNIILEHHEDIDGSGYPFQLREEMISKYSKLVAIVDMYDALTTDRSYEYAIESVKAIEVMNECSSKFDHKMYDKFRTLVLNRSISK